MSHIEALRAGKRVLWITEGTDDTRATLSAHSSEQGLEIDRITLTRGRERIDYRSGASIVYINPRSGTARGYSADTISVPLTVSENEKTMAELIPCLAQAATATLIVR